MPISRVKGLKETCNNNRRYLHKAIPIPKDAKQNMLNRHCVSYPV